MSDFLDNIRKAENTHPIKQAVNTICVLLFGIALGILSKYLDCTPSNELPFIVNYLDIRNFLGRFAIWLFLAVCISVYSISPARAAVNVFAFFAGMVTSYYLYSELIAGFFPRSYAMIWTGLTILSPCPAFICWYAKGSGWISLIISGGILAVLFNETFQYGWGYFGMRSLPELSVFLCGLAVLRRRNIKETVWLLGIGFALALVMNLTIPFRFG